MDRLARNPGFERPAPPTAPYFSSTRLVLKLSLLSLAVLTIYHPSFHGEWLWDDDLDVANNSLLRSAAGLWKIWFAPATATLDYYPVKSTVQWFQWHLWGNALPGYHLTNVFLHLLSALLFWRILGKLGVSAAWFGALLFAIHPLAVESVAWIAELKNALSLPLLLLASNAWLEFEQEGCRSRYLWSLAWFLISMLTKSSAVMFPCALLLFALTKRGRLQLADALRAIPFFGISLVLGLVTLWFQHARAQQAGAIELGEPLMRLAVAGCVFAQYAWKSIWPVPLLPIYPRWTIAPGDIWPFLPWVGMIALFTWLWLRRTPPARLALFGLGWFALNLVPFLGFVPISYMRFTWVMDHMTYVSLLGVCGLAACGLGAALQSGRKSIRLVTLAGATAITIFYLTLAQRHASRFASARAFWSYELQHVPTSAIAHSNLGQALEQDGESVAAIEHLRRAVELDGNFFEARINLGNALSGGGRADEAVQELRRALQMQPNASVAHYNLALALGKANQGSAALAEFDETLRLKPDWPEAMFNRGILLRQLGRFDEAIRDLSSAARLSPDFADGHNELALVLLDANRPAEAGIEFVEALRLKPTTAEFHNNYGTTLARLGRMPDAIEQFSQAVRLRPGYIDAHLNLGIALLGSGRSAEAVAHLATAADKEPTSLRARYNFGCALLALGRNEEAVRQLEAALQLSPNHPAIHQNLALALSAVGRREDATTHYLEARRLDPSLPPRSF